MSCIHKYFLKQPFVAPPNKEIIRVQEDLFTILALLLCIIHDSERWATHRTTLRLDFARSTRCPWAKSSVDGNPNKTRVFLTEHPIQN